DRRLEALLRRVVHPEVHVGRSVAGIELHDLREAADRVAVVSLVPGDVAQRFGALYVVGWALEGRPGLSRAGRATSQRDLGPPASGVELQRLAIFARTLLQIPPPVREVAAEDMARNTPVHGHLGASALDVLQ